MTPVSFYLDALTTLRDWLANSYQVYQITEDQKEELHWSECDADSATPLFGSQHLPLLAPKGLLFVDNDPLYRFDGESFTPVTNAPSPFVLFGVQACDLAAIAYQDKIFEQDPHYQMRRQQALLIGIDCDSPCKQGFCTQMDAGPSVRKHTADLVISRICDASDNATHPWLLQATTDKGLQAIEAMSLTLAAPTELAKKQAHAQEVERRFATREELTKGIEAINHGQVSAEVWQSLGLRCLACSGCTSLCPTCSCFSVYDEQQDGQVVTTRCWDSCQYDGFQREASGHNPSHLAGQRTERFWFHKFGEAYHAKYGRYGCTGCARCELTCPGSVGVHSVMKRISQSCTS